jgi:hypothetical protein
MNPILEMTEECLESRVLLVKSIECETISAEATYYLSDLRQVTGPTCSQIIIL